MKEKAAGRQGPVSCPKWISFITTAQILLFYFPRLAAPLPKEDRFWLFPSNLNWGFLDENEYICRRSLITLCQQSLLFIILFRVLKMEGYFSLYLHTNTHTHLMFHLKTSHLPSSSPDNPFCSPPYLLVYVKKRFFPLPRHNFKGSNNSTKFHFRITYQELYSCLYG